MEQVGLHLLMVKQRSIILWGAQPLPSTQSLLKFLLLKLTLKLISIRFA